MLLEQSVGRWSSTVLEVPGGVLEGVVVAWRCGLVMQVRNLLVVPVLQSVLRGLGEPVGGRVAPVAPNLPLVSFGYSLVVGCCVGGGGGVVTCVAASAYEREGGSGVCLGGSSRCNWCDRYGVVVFVCRFLPLGI